MRKLIQEALDIIKKRTAAMASPEASGMAGG
jgi:hypothetical protein